MDLPDELVLEIFKHLNHGELWKVGKVCSHFKNVAMDWTLYPYYTPNNVRCITYADGIQRAFIYCPIPLLKNLMEHVDIRPHIRWIVQSTVVRERYDVLEYLLHGQYFDLDETKFPLQYVPVTLLEHAVSVRYAKSTELLAFLHPFKPKITVCPSRRIKMTWYCYNRYISTNPKVVSKIVKETERSIEILVDLGVSSYPNMLREAACWWKHPHLFDMLKEHCGYNKEIHWKSINAYVSAQLEHYGQKYEDKMEEARMEMYDFIYK